MSSVARSPFRIGIAGLGTVGAATVQILQRDAARIAAIAGREIKVVAISARSKAQDRGISLQGITWFDNPVALAGSDLDCVVELIGGAEGIAHQTMSAALQHGKPVVTANKAMIAAHGFALASLAEKHNTTIAFEAAVAGGIPVIKALREGFVGNNISRISGIMNGTCNYILSRMEAENLTFAECLKAAQELGYAEADPAFDIEGYDTAHKLAILTALAFGTKIDPDSIYVEGITNVTPLDISIASELGYRIKLLGVAEQTAKGIEQRVHPTMVPKSTALANVMGVTNAVAIAGSAMNEITLVGPGAGGLATASSVISDIVDLARGTHIPTFGQPVVNLKPLAQRPMQSHEGGYYIRINALNKSGAAKSIVGAMADQGISLESILQKATAQQQSTEAAVPVILITYATSEGAISNALQKIETEGFLSGKPQVIRIER